MRLFEIEGLKMFYSKWGIHNINYILHYSLWKLDALKHKLS